MNYWSLLPRPLRAFLLGQPLPELWLADIRASLELSAEEQTRESLGLTWKRSYNMIAALAILVLSAYVMYCILG